MITLADAIRGEFERTHPHGKNTLLCGGCRRRKDRVEFRETPWHGRAEDCWNCEGGFSVNRMLRVSRGWELAQTQEKLRAYQRYAGYLKLRLLLADAPRSADVIRAAEQPYRDAVERLWWKWAAGWHAAFSEAHTALGEDA